MGSVNCNRHTKQPKARTTKRFRHVKGETSLSLKRRIHIKMGEESGYSWFCWRRSPAYVAAGKTEPELNPSPLQRASGTVLVELVELPMGPFSISTTGGNNNGNCKELSNESLSSSSTSTGTEKRLSPVSSSLSIHPSISSSMSSISSNSSSSLPPYSELVKELGTL